MINKTQQFRVIIEQDEDGFFVASAPELPGMPHSGQNNARIKQKNQRSNIALFGDVTNR